MQSLERKKKRFTVFPMLYKNELRSVLQKCFFQNAVLPLICLCLLVERKQTGQEEIFFFKLSFWL